MTRIRSLTITGATALLLLAGTGTAHAGYSPEPFSGTLISYPGKNPPTTTRTAPRPAVHRATRTRHAEPVSVRPTKTVAVGTAHIAQMKPLPEGF